MKTFVKATLRRIKTETVDACTYFFLPIPALLLPWFIAYRIYFRLAAFQWVFAYPSRVAAENMAQFGITDDLPAFEAKRRFRLVLMMDIVDMWLSIVRGRHALKRLVKQNRNWPSERPLMVIGSHWGPGMLGLRSMRSQGLLPHFVIRPVPSELKRTRFLFWLYRRVRTWHLNQLLPGKRFNTGTSPRRLIQAMEGGAAILMLADTPADNERETIPVDLYGRSAFIHRGFTKTLARRKIAYVTFSMGLDWHDGRRAIDVRPVRIESQAQVIQDDLAQFINDTLWRDPGQWQMWPFTKQFLRFVEPAPGS
ncbi:MAG: hypothetical protein MI750_12395 [Xanthomonadales bacterium]|nr:hypothetical protein [Xanthomonadales bacterium]